MRLGRWIVMGAVAGFGCRTEDPGNDVLQVQIDELVDRVSLLEAADDAAATKEAEQDAKNAEQDAAIEEIAGTDVGQVLTQVQDHEDAIVGLLDDVDAQGDSVEALQADVSDLEAHATDLDASILGAETALAALDTRTDATEADILAMQADITTLTARIAAEEATNLGQAATIATQASTLASQSTALTALSSDVSTAKGDIVDLEGDVASITSDVSAMASDLAAAETDIAATKSVNATQDTTLASHASTLTSQASTLSTQASTISSMGSTISSQGTTISGHTSTLATHASTLSSYGVRITDVEGDMSTAQADIADLELQGKFYRKTYASETGQDTGLIPDRNLTFTKVGATTPLHILYYDNFRAIGNAGDCRWEVLINGASCTNPGRLSQDLHVTANDNMHFASAVQGICTATTNGAIGAGTVTLTVNLTRVYYGSTDCYTGWNSGRGMIEAFEITQ
jgi:hypothetical protein